MTSINDLLKKSKQSVISEKQKVSDKKFVLNFANKEVKSDEDIIVKDDKVEALEEKIPTLDPIVPSPISQPSPFAGLADSISNINLDLDSNDSNGISNSNSETSPQFSSPTLTDVSKFVFDGQPEKFDPEITETMAGMLDQLSESLGDQIPTNLAKCLNFIKEHDFLADILKPESESILVNACRKSYGFIVNVKSEKAVKKKKANEKVNTVLDSLGDLSF